ncbi:FKBP-type peptidyl-prolyl cis-trans isomerase [Enterobacter bugandensis]|uniref:FKBP-type peptidyl-prolyl cis-trans isomerase n=1 Tax=Enterobacter bugandensis TaxID=881260 RepID=UPI0021CF4689|nr:FKBP-type peptidyl-prolyl cis-trans isomerase [Enterobacter bugandensis]MCU6216048.1 FKBP-type peptidyl-prolyl cis-trans isomerase [Enterobacter bugandensis]
MERRMINRRLTRLSFCIATLVLTPRINAAEPALTGYNSDKTIPYSLFDDTEKKQPWIKPPVPRTPALRPATTGQAKENQRVQSLEKSLSEQQRLYKETLDKHAAEIQSLQNQLRSSEVDREAMVAQREKLDALQRALAEAQAQHDNSDRELAKLRTKVAAQQMLEDSRAITESAFADRLKEKEDSLLAMSQQIEALKAENNVLSEKQQAVKPQTREQKMSYANGVAFASDIVRVLRAQQEVGIEPDRPMVLAGLKDAFGQRIALPENEIADLVSDLDRQLNEKVADQQQQQMQTASQQKKLGEELIKKTKNRPGMKEMDGAYYVVIKKGEGAKLSADSTAEMLITGTLADGTVFDKSGEQNDVQQLKIDTLLPAVSKIISQHNVGSELEIILPPERAFGEKGAEPLIPPGATLVLKIKITGAL